MLCITTCITFPIDDLSKILFSWKNNGGIRTCSRLMLFILTRLFFDTSNWLLVGVIAWVNQHFGMQSWNFQKIISLLLKTYLDQKPKTLADFIISRSVRPLKLFDPSFLLEGPLFSCNLQIEKISGPQEAARLVFYFAKHG